MDKKLEKRVERLESVVVKILEMFQWAYTEEEHAHYHVIFDEDDKKTFRELAEKLSEVEDD